MRFAILALLAGCQVKKNQLITPGSPRSAVKPPHEAIFVERETDLVAGRKVLVHRRSP